MRAEVARSEAQKEAEAREDGNLENVKSGRTIHSWAVQIHNY